MNRNIGFKHVAAGGAFAAALVLVVVQMVQLDRLWDQQQGVRAEVGLLSARVEQLRKEVAFRPLDSGAGRGAANAAGKLDESWAVAGVPIRSSAAARPQNDPRMQPDFAEGGELVVLAEIGLESVTPMMYADTYGRMINEEVVESLGRLNPETLELEPWLAQAWQLDPAGRWIRARIRDEACFSDGSPVTAEDVRWTLEGYIFNTELKCGRFRAMYNPKPEVVVLGPKVVEFRFAELSFDWKTRALLMPVLPKGVYERFSAERINGSKGLLVGSGPFRMEAVLTGQRGGSEPPPTEWSKRRDLVLVRNERYWGSPAPLASIRVKAAVNPASRVSMYRDGEADVFRPTMRLSVELAEADPAERLGRVLSFPTYQGQWSFVAWQCGRRAGGRLTPFADARVRRAMTMLIDREQIARDLSYGLGRVATGLFDSGTPQADKAITPWPFDLTKAKVLLAEAGWSRDGEDRVLRDRAGEPFEFELCFPEGSDWTLGIAKLIEARCADVGIRCRLAPYNWEARHKTMIDDRDFDAVLISWSPGSPELDPQSYWSSAAISGAGDNFAQWSNAEADRLIAKGRGLTDDAQRMAVWHELHRLWHQEQPFTPLLETPWQRVISRRVGNVRLYKTGLKLSELYIPKDRQ